MHYSTSSWWHNKWQRNTGLSLAIAINMYLLGPYILNAVACALIRTDEATSVDLIISLSGDAYCLRELKAAELYQKGLAKTVVVSGYPYGPDVDTSTASKAYLQSLGIPSGAVICSPDGVNTRIEAKKITTLMRTNGWHSAIIVTSPFHTRRAHFTFQQAATELTFYTVPTPAEAPEWQPANWWKRRGDCGQTIRELFAWGNTLVNGWK